MHDYLIEGLDLVFRKRGLPGIAELKKKHADARSRGTGSTAVSLAAAR